MTLCSWSCTRSTICAATLCNPLHNGACWGITRGFPHHGNNQRRPPLLSQRAWHGRLRLNNADPPRQRLEQMFHRSHCGVTSVVCAANTILLTILVPNHAQTTPPPHGDFALSVRTTDRIRCANCDIDGPPLNRFLISTTALESTLRATLRALTSPCVVCSGRLSTHVGRGWTAPCVVDGGGTRGSSSESRSGQIKLHGGTDGTPGTRPWSWI